MAKGKSHGRKKVSDEKLKKATAYKNFPASIERISAGNVFIESLHWQCRSPGEC